jgi:hypothetical protein
VEPSFARSACRACCIFKACREKLLLLLTLCVCLNGAGGKKAHPFPDSGREEAVSQDVAAAVTAWVERVLVPAVNRQVGGKNLRSLPTFC